MWWRARERLARALLALLAPLVFLALLEVAAGLGGVTPLARDAEYRRLARARGCRTSPVQARNLCRPETLVPSRPKRVVALGGSSVQGFPIGETTPFSEHLGLLLEAAHPGEYAVFNRGLFCKDSIYVRDCARNVLAARPDYLVIYSGHNDFGNWGYEVPRRRIFLEENAWIYELEQQLFRSRAVSMLKRGFDTLREALPRTNAELSEAHRARSRTIIVDKFEANLLSVIERAGDAGAEVILVTVVSNLHEFPARRESWSTWRGRAEGGAAGAARWVAPFARGIDAFEQGRFEVALRAFKEARDRYGRGRAPTELNERIRRLGERFAHVHVVDFERELDRRGAREGIGCNFFGSHTYCDQFHPNSHTQRWIGEAIFRALSALRGAAAASPPT